MYSLNEKCWSRNDLTQRQKLQTDGEGTPGVANEQTKRNKPIVFAVVVVRGGTGR